MKIMLRRKGIGLSLEKQNSRHQNRVKSTPTGLQAFFIINLTEGKFFKAAVKINGFKMLQYSNKMKTKNGLTGISWPGYKKIKLKTKLEQTIMTKS